jgi:hypothetical protein
MGNKIKNKKTCDIRNLNTEPHSITKKPLYLTLFETKGIPTDWLTASIKLVTKNYIPRNN